MSKTIELQIEKSRVLIEGLRKNIDALAGKGISDSDLQSMTKDLEQSASANEECDRVREE